MINKIQTWAYIGFVGVFLVSGLATAQLETNPAKCAEEIARINRSRRALCEARRVLREQQEAVEARCGESLFFVCEELEEDL